VFNNLDSVSPSASPDIVPLYRHPKMKTLNFSLRNRTALEFASRGKPHLAVDEEPRLASMDNRFSVIASCTAIAHGCSIESIKLYAQEYKDDDDEFKEMMRIATSVLFYATDRHDQEIANLLLDYGADLNGTGDEENFIPPLAFAMREDQSAQLHKCTELVKLPHRIIGQLPVVSPLQRDVLNHIAGNVDESEPMVMVFKTHPAIA
jgi:hypothetical protein